MPLGGGRASPAAGGDSCGQADRHILVEAIRRLVLIPHRVATSRRDDRVKLHSRRERGTSLGMDALPEFPELPFHPTAVFVPGWLAFALTFEALGLLVSVDPTAVAP